MLPKPFELMCATVSLGLGNIVSQQFPTLSGSYSLCTFSSEMISALWEQGMRYKMSHLGLTPAPSFTLFMLPSVLSLYEPPSTTEGACLLLPECSNL